MTIAILGTGSVGKALANGFVSLAHTVRIGSRSGTKLTQWISEKAPKVEGGRPTMFIAGNSENAKKTVVDILNSFGWDTNDMGTVVGARAIEPLAML